MTKNPTSSTLEAAIAHHRAGRLVDAERLYRQVLEGTPGEARASHNLALILLERGDDERGLALLATACAADPTNQNRWTTYARALGVRGQFEPALQILAARLPDGAERDALEALVRRTWAQTLLQQGALDVAEAQLVRVAELAPRGASAYVDLGLVQLRLGRPGDAEINFRHALTVEVGDRPATVNLSIALQRQGRHDEALAEADIALAQEIDAEALIARGDALRSLGRDVEAVGVFIDAARSEAHRFAALMRAGGAQVALRQYEPALATYSDAMASRPESPEAPFYRGQVRMLLGDFQGGWRDYEFRWRRDTFLAESGGIITPDLLARLEPNVDCRDLVGRRVLLLGEQGVGDQVMFASLIPELTELAADVTCICDRRLVGLLSASLRPARFLPPSTTDVRYSEVDKVVAIGSLAGLFRNHLDDFPGCPYLTPGPLARDRWAARLGSRQAGLRIGLSWRGGSPMTNSRRRSLDLVQLAPLLDLPDCEFISLQYGDVDAEVAAASVQLGRPIRVFPKAEIDDFEDLAGLIETLDVVVSVQNTVVHLAGAIGKECLGLLPYSPEWRYAADSPTMPWYGSVRLYRQSAPGAWGPVIGEVIDALKDRAGRGPAPA